MDKKQYIAAQIARTNRKSYENYVITRIVHAIDDLDVQFTTQQYIKRPQQSGKPKWGLADLYFPQVKIIVEVDEAYHEKQVAADDVKDADYALALGSKPYRVKTGSGQTIETIHDRCEEIAEIVRQKVRDAKANGTFRLWELEHAFDPLQWIAKGRISVDDNVVFLKSVDACRCMGLNYKAYQRGSAKHPVHSDTDLWFPKLYREGKWDNHFDDKKGVITERCLGTAKEQREHVAKYLNYDRKKRIVFAKLRSNLGRTLYRFRGVFELVEAETRKQGFCVWRRIATEAETFDYRNSAT